MIRANLAAGQLAEQRATVFVVVAAMALTSVMSAALAQNFEAHSKRLGDGKMDIVIREIERRPRVSVLEIEVNKVGSSVGSSFFILCSVRQMARQRGNARYAVKIEEHGNPARMIVGFLATENESQEGLGPPFDTQRTPREVIDLEQFAPICEMMK